MSVEIHAEDPAKKLWLRCNPGELQKFWDKLDKRPVPVGEIANSLGIQVASKMLPTDISGSIRCIEGVYKIEVNNTDSPLRQRFTVSHEIAHFLLHRDLIDAVGITDTVLYRSNLSSAKEAEANRLAAAILLPWSQVIAWHQEKFEAAPSKQTVETISETYRASRLAVGYRFGL